MDALDAACRKALERGIALVGQTLEALVREIQAREGHTQCFRCWDAACPGGECLWKPSCRAAESVLRQAEREGLRRRSAEEPRTRIEPAPRRRSRAWNDEML
jgi:hypothetical protein